MDIRNVIDLTEDRTMCRNLMSSVYLMKEKKRRKKTITKCEGK